jgi:hypothetical protein
MANFPAKDAAGTVIPDKFTPTARFNTHYSVQVDTLMATVDVNAPLGVDGKPGALCHGRKHLRRLPYGRR